MFPHSIQPPVGISQYYTEVTITLRNEKQTKLRPLHVNERNWTEGGERQPPIHPPMLSSVYTVSAHLIFECPIQWRIQAGASDAPPSPYQILSLLEVMFSSVCQEFCPQGRGRLCPSMHHRSHDWGVPGVSLGEGHLCLGGPCVGGCLGALCSGVSFRRPPIR